MISSTAHPTVTPDGTHELTRRWEASEPKASVLIVHGIGEHSGRYEHVGGWFAERGFTVEAFDLIGCGATGGARGDIEDWTVFLDQIESHLTPMIDDPLPSVILGHSMGGLLAAEYLASERPKPDLAVLSAPGLLGGAAWQRSVSRVLSPVIGKVSIPSGIKGEDLSRDPAVGEAYFADPLVHTKATVRLGDALFRAMDRTSAGVGLIEVPTLVIHGTADNIVPPRASEVFEPVEAAEHRTYQDLRHELHNEPEGHQIYDEVIDWVEGHLSSD
jgi:alpha-beta hydrolase superfamily lysophospholipase